MDVCHTAADLRAARSALRGRVGFVPTMGALHDGHLSLVDLAKADADAAVASVFVNPTQFDDAADLDAYPRTLDDDLAKLDAAGVAVAFCPDAAEVYPPGRPRARVDVPALTTVLEGEHRPGHFAGVCEVVLKLFNLVRPDVAAFGMKDFQQLRVIEAMTAALDLPVEILRGPTLRDDDGLAMSSRNRRLSAESRAAALAIPRSLDAAAGAWEQGERDPAALGGVLRDGLASLDVDYAAVVDGGTLRPTEVAGPGTLLAVAARVGLVRLIDNRLMDVG